MAAPSFAFEKKQAPKPEHEGEVFEVVNAPTLEEVSELLEAGASFVTYQSAKETLDESGDWPVNKKITTVYLAASPENMEKLLESGHFDSDWEKDDETYSPNVCLKSEKAGSVAALRETLQEIFPDQLKIASSEMYAWNKAQEKRENLDKAKKRKAAGA